MGHSRTQTVTTFAGSTAGRIALVAGLLLTTGGPALAQQYYDPGILMQTVSEMPRDYQAEGVKLGSFTLSPFMQVGVEKHDNIYYQHENEISDTIYHLRPGATLSSGWSRHALSVSLLTDFARFGDSGREDYDDLMLSADARIDVQRGDFFTVRGASMRLHEDRSSPDDARGTTPTEFTLNRFGLGYTHNFNRLTGSLSWNRDRTQYDGNVNEDGEFIDSTDRDRDLDNFELRLDWLQAPQRSLFLSAGMNRVSYDLAQDFEGYARDSDGYRVQAGVAFDISGVLTGDVYGQYLKQEYDDPRFGGVDDTGFGMGLHWYPTQLTSLHFRAEHQPLETTQSYSSSYLASFYSVRLQHELRRWLLLHARASYTDNEYSLSADAPEFLLTDTQVKRADIGLSYLFNRHLNLTAGYAWEDQHANLLERTYNANRYYLVLGMQL